MSKIPSFGFKSKLKAPIALRGKSGTVETRIDQNKANEKTTTQPTTQNSMESVPIYHSHEKCLDEDGNDFGQMSSRSESGDCTNNNNKAVIVHKSLERTSNNLSKLADKLDAGNTKPTGEQASKLPQKPAFRKRGSSNIAKLNTGKGKERTGASQIHGQTPYMKSLKPEAKPPAGKQKFGVKPTGLRSLSQLATNQNSKGAVVTRGQSEKKISNANETFEMPADKEADASPSSKIDSRFSGDISQINSATAATKFSSATATPSTANVIRRPAPAGGLRSGLRPPSGNFSSSSIGPAVAKGDAKMKPPSRPSSRGSKDNLLKASEAEVKSGVSKGVAIRRGSGQEGGITKRGSKDNLKSSGIVTPRQKPPSKELQSMAEKLICYSGRKLQRPLSVASGSDLSQSSSKAPALGKGRQRLAPNLRTVNSSSLQDISRLSNKDLSDTKTHRRSGSFTSSTKENFPKKTGSSTSLSGSKLDCNSSKKSVAGPRKPSTGMAQPRSRSSSKTLCSTNSEFGILGARSMEPYQSTPLQKMEGFDNERAMAEKELLYNAVNDDISAVFYDDGKTPAPNKGPIMKSGIGARRILNQTFDGEEQNRTFDAISNKNDTFAKVDLERKENIKEAGMNSTYSKIVQPNATFTKDGEPGVDENETFNISSPNFGSHEKSTSSCLEDTENTEDILGSDSMGPSDSCANYIEERNEPALDKESSLPDGLKVASAGKGEPEIDGYCSDDFLINESMPHLDGSLTMNISEELRDVKSSSPLTSDDKNKVPNEIKKSINSSLQPHEIPLPKSASRSLEFSEQKMQKVDDVLATSLINDSYDVVTLEEASESDDNSIVGVDAKKKNISSLAQTRDSQSDAERLAKEANQLTEEIEKRRKSSPVSVIKENQLSPDGEKEARVIDSLPSSYNSAEDGRPVAPNKFQIEIPESKDDQQATESKLDQIDTNKIDKNFASLLSQNVETLLADSLGHDKATVDSLLGSLLSPGFIAEPKPDTPANLPTVQMKIAAKRRPLIRRNTSPYVTSLDALSLGTSFRMPRETSIVETEDGKVSIDGVTFRSFQNETRQLKTQLLKLKRVLHEADIMSPFLKHPNKLGTSPPVTPTRTVSLSRSFSDASSWLTKARKTPDLLNFGDCSIRYNTATTTATAAVSSVNKTDEDKVEDEMKEMKEKMGILEREVEELKHDLESKDYTIKLLQTQLENQEYSEQIELLTEEKIMLLMENQELKETMEQLECQLQGRSSSISRSMKDEYLKQSQSASKMKAEIVQSYYDKGDE